MQMRISCLLVAIFIHKLREENSLPWVALFIIIHKNTLGSNKLMLIAHSQTIFETCFFSLDWTVMWHPVLDDAFGKIRDKHG